MSSSVLTGYLFKLGQKGVLKFYKKRWFVLSSNQDIIFYYVSKLDMKLCGQINVKDILHTTTSKNESFNKGSTWGFELTTPGRVYYLYASTEHDRIYWIEGVTARINQLRKKEEETKQKTFGIINDLKIWRKNAPPGGTGKGTGSGIEDEGNPNSNDDDVNSDDSGSYKTGYVNSANSTPIQQNERMKLEMEIENKENLISKLTEEKLAFEQYAKELEEEKAQLQKENEKIAEQMEVSKVEELVRTIEKLETEREELKQDIEAVQNELEEEKSFRSQILKDKNLLEKNFDVEKSQLIHIAEESESGMKKAIQLMQSGTISTSNNNNNSSKVKTNWNSELFTLERSAARLRKTKETYYHENIRLKKKIEESIRSHEKERPLSQFEELLSKLKSRSENNIKEDINSILPIVNSEINQLREFMDGNANTLSNGNDIAITDYLGQNYKPDESDIDLGGDIVTEDESLSDSKIKMKYPLSQSETQIKNTSSELLSISTSSESGQLKDQLNELDKHLVQGKEELDKCTEELKTISNATESLPLYQDVMDPLESRLELFMNKMEPIINGVDLSDQNEELLNELKWLQEEISRQNQHFQDEKKQADKWIESIQLVDARVSNAIESSTKDLKEPLLLLSEQLEEEIFSKEKESNDIFKHALYDILQMKKKLVLLKSLEEIQSKKTITYVAKPEDQLDVLVESAIQSFSANSKGSIIPPNFERLGEGLYQFGTKRINTTILAGQLMVRVGGGFMTFEEFVLKYGRAETIKILRTPSKAQLKKQQSYQDIPMPFRPTSRASTRL